MSTRDFQTRTSQWEANHSPQLRHCTHHCQYRKHPNMCGSYSRCHLCYYLPPFYLLLLLHKKFPTVGQIKVFLFQLHRCMPISQPQGIPSQYFTPWQQSLPAFSAQSMHPTYPTQSVPSNQPQPTIIMQPLLPSLHAFEASVGHQQQCTLASQPAYQLLQSSWEPEMISTSM